MTFLCKGPIGLSEEGEAAMSHGNDARSDTRDYALVPDRPPASCMKSQVFGAFVSSSGKMRLWA